MNQNQLSKTRQFDESKWLNHKFSFDDNRNIPPDSSVAYDSQEQNNRNVYDYHHDDVAEKDYNDEGNGKRR